MAAYRRVYDSRHLQADCKNRDRLRNSTLGNRVWASFFSFAAAKQVATQTRVMTNERVVNWVD